MFRRSDRSNRYKLRRHAVFVIKNVTREEDGEYIVSCSFGLRGREEEWDTVPLRVDNSVEVELTAELVLSTLSDRR